MSSLPQSSGIYRITCTSNNKTYIGSAANLNIRWYRHLYALDKGNHHNRHLQNAYNKHGADAFVVDVLELCGKGVLKEREQYYLDLLKPFTPNGFNIAFDAMRPQLGRVTSAETRAKISAIHKGKKLSEEQRTKLSIAHMNRPPITDETRQKLSASNVGKKRSAETGARISAALTGRKLSPEHIAKSAEGNRGKKLSEETRAKISEAMKGNTNGSVASPEKFEKMSTVHKRSYIITTPQGEEIRIRGLYEFCAEQGLDPTSMSKVANGKLPHYKRWLCRHA